MFDFGEAEIEDFDAGFYDEDVGGFEVAMDDGFFMRRFERGGELDAEFEGLIEW